eukprot:800917-Pelagomonas_calceolata.AAC.3
MGSGGRQFWGAVQQGLMWVVCESTWFLRLTTSAGRLVPHEERVHLGVLSIFVITSHALLVVHEDDSSDEVAAGQVCMQADRTSEIQLVLETQSGTVPRESMQPYIAIYEDGGSAQTMRKIRQKHAHNRNLTGGL